jgi:hypothetical protein
MTVAQFIKKIDNAIRIIEAENKPLALAVLSINQMRVKRIFEDGLGSNNAAIGTYNSTTPIYVADVQAPKKVNHKGKNGKPIKSGYYKSYKDFRQAMGRESGKVNLRLNNDLQSDLANGKITKGSNSVAAPNPIKVTTHSYKITLKRDINIKKIDGLEKKHGSILRHTALEKKEFYRVLRLEQKNRISQLLG